MVVLVSLAVAGCANVNPRVPIRIQSSNGRFLVSFTRQVVNEAANHNVDLTRLTQEDLAQIDTLLPGPKMTVTVTVGDPDQIIAAVGATGFTDPETGAVTIGLYPSWLEEPFDVSRGLARTLAREVDRSVRITSGAGVGGTLLDQVIADGVATAFGESAFPGPPDPWVGALTAKQECQQWGHLKPLLETVGIHGEVLTGGSVSSVIFGESSMPLLTGRAIGYHIVADYLARTGKTSWAVLAAAPAEKIYQASDYAPCQSG
jgi:uncharacterized protein YjaZ